MKLFQQLMLAPAALGLVAPLAAYANGYDLASSTSAINTYTQQQDLDRFRAWEAQNQVTSINQFADVQPTSWAYQALSNLIERYGCVAGYPNGTFKGGQALTRYEAAALLNACLDRVTEVTEELQRLLNDFQKELAVIRGRVDGLEKKVGKLEATQFSTTTKLQGEATMVLGGVSYGGDGVNSSNQVIAGSGNPPQARNAVTFNYDLRLNLLTSFTGKDLLYTRLRSGNFADSAFSGSPVPMANLDKAFSPTGGSNVVNIDRLYYRFPVGKEFRLTVGPRVRNTEMIAFRPQAYNADILDFFTLAGAPGAYNKATGTGIGLEWRQTVKKGKPYLTFGVNYVAERGENGATGPTTNVAGAQSPNNGGGLFSSYGANNLTAQLGARADNWGLAALYRYGTCGTSLRRGTPMASSAILCNSVLSIDSATGDLTNNLSAPGNNASTNSIGLGAFWQPKKTGIIPSVSLGWGYTSLSQSSPVQSTLTTNSNRATRRNGILNVASAQSWSAMFQWDNAFAKGNAAGFAFGQGTMATGTNRNGQQANDSNYAFEWFYRFKVSDNISVTPAIFYLSQPLGQQSRAQPNTLSNTGILVQTQFRF